MGDGTEILDLSKGGPEASDHKQAGKKVQLSYRKWGPIQNAMITIT